VLEAPMPFFANALGDTAPPKNGHAILAASPQAAPASEQTIAPPAEPEPGNGSKPVLDEGAVERLLDVIGGEHEILVEIIDSFLDDAPALLSKLRQAAEQQDAESLRRAAHTLKSNTADFGASTLNGMCKELEYRARDGALNNVLELVAHAEQEYDHVKVALEAVRDEHAG
jgi:HPt (histidine-containing phosphotransfer) domain-containing protein